MRRTSLCEWVGTRTAPVGPAGARAPIPIPSSCVPLCLLLLLALSLACASPDSGLDEDEEQADPLAELVRVEARNGILLVRPDHHLGDYDAILFDPIVFTYRRGQIPLPESDERRITKMLRKQLVDGAEAAGIGIATEPGPCVLRSQLHLADLELLDRKERGAGSLYLSTAGSVTIVNHYSDSRTGASLLQYGQRKGLPGGKVLGPEGSLSTEGLAKAVGMMNRDLNQELVRIVPTTLEQRPDVGCAGVIGKLRTGKVPFPE